MTTDRRLELVEQAREMLRQKTWLCRHTSIAALLVSLADELEAAVNREVAR